MTSPAPALVAREEAIGGAEGQMIPAPRTPMELMDRALASGAGVETLSKLMDLQERWEKSQARRAFENAMANAKAKLPIIQKNRHVGFDSKKAGASRTNYWHEDLAQVAQSIGPVLASEGLSYRFRTQSAPNEPVTVTCIISHRDGHFEENSLSAPKDDTGNKNSIQAIGSTVTYLQRYTLKAAFGLAASRDDDSVSVSTEFLTEEQIGVLRSAIIEVDADLPQFLKYMRVESLEAIPVSDYDRAIQGLEAKRRKTEGSK